MDRLLLHSCCAPCSTYSVKSWRERGFEVSSFWYNPNIQPFSEHQRRIEAHRDYCRRADLPLVEQPGYEMVKHLRLVVNREGDRCVHCYRLRLEATACAAGERGFGAFSTTLLISPYQKHELLRQVGEEVAAETGVKFLYADLRPGYRESRRMAAELELYRQKYCGCVYSEYDRFARVQVQP